MPFVLDASVTMAWCFTDERTAYTRYVLQALRTSDARVPSTWPLEVANVLLIAERRQRITSVRSMRFGQLLRALPIRVEETAVGPAFDSILALGRDQGLSAYDASYLDLAMRLGLPLATRDTRLGQAAGRVDVALLREETRDDCG